MAIVFASVACIAGREAISSFVDRFVVPRATKRGGGYRTSDVGQSRSGSRGFRIVDSRDWVKTGTSIDESLATTVEQIREG